MVGVRRNLFFGDLIVEIYRWRFGTSLRVWKLDQRSFWVEWIPGLWSAFVDLVFGCTDFDFLVENSWGSCLARARCQQINQRDLCCHGSCRLTFRSPGRTSLSFPAFWRWSDVGSANSDSACGLQSLQEEPVLSLDWTASPLGSLKAVAFGYQNFFSNPIGQILTSAIHLEFSYWSDNIIAPHTVHSCRLMEPLALNSASPRRCFTSWTDCLLWPNTLDNLHSSLADWPRKFDLRLSESWPTESRSRSSSLRNSRISDCPIESRGVLESQNPNLWYIQAKPQLNFGDLHFFLKI